MPARPSLIRFEDVSFEYEPGKPVLSRVSFELEAGRDARAGGSHGRRQEHRRRPAVPLHGSQPGRITLDGSDLRDFDPQQLRRRFGLVLQDLYLFPASVEDNLRAFRPEIPSEQVVAAARTAGLDELIRRRPVGYAGVLQNRGRDLSYGQRQLMAFARALAVDPPILVLDEATSSVDPGTERKIQDTLARLTLGRTTVVVAHRLSTIRRADRILVVAGGGIAEAGSHDELLAQGGLYAELVAVQMGEVRRAG